jgi:magnesium transporter
MSPDDRTQLLAELPGQATQRLLNLLPEDELREASWLLGYPEGSVGRLMTPDYVAVRPHWTVGEALRHIRAHGRDSETVNRIFVVDDGWRLIDDIELRHFILADADTPVTDLMDAAVASISAFADREDGRHHDPALRPDRAAGGGLRRRPRRHRHRGRRTRRRRAGGHRGLPPRRRPSGRCA